MRPGFSRRTSWDVSESAFAAAVRTARQLPRKIHDLTVSNPTICGFKYDADTILQPLINTNSLVYSADSKGLPQARAAVARYYRNHDAEIDPAHILLTTSTSEGYSYLFRLLCDAGDEVLVAQPSYPLFDFLAELEDVVLKPYPLFYDYGWCIDIAALRRQIGPRTKAIVVVHPNNPTGHATSAFERKELEALCSEFGMALIVDEVFLDYPVGDGNLTSFARGDSTCLTFILSGLSKIAGLPQMKAGWIVTRGPDELRQKAMERLEVIADTFLSMNAPVQWALPSWLEAAGSVREQVKSRVMSNLEVLRRCGLEVLQLDGGWSSIVRLRGQSPDQELALDLIEKHRVIVHPGSFYGLAGRGFIVVSLISEEEEFAGGAALLARYEAVNGLGSSQV